MNYLVQCIAGLQQLVLGQLRQDLAGVTALAVEDGFLAFTSSSPASAVRQLTYINNAFAVIQRMEGEETNALVEQLAKDRSWFAAARGLTDRHDRRFRVCVSNEGQLVSGGRAMAKLVDHIARATGIVPARATDTEFWILRRRGGRAFFAKRLTRRIGTDRTLQPGELRPQLTQLMCFLSEPSAEDIVLDPFCGTGVLPLARMRMPYNMIFAMDANREKVAALRQQLREGKVRPRKNSPVIAAAGDARQLDRFDAGFVHKIITDPPWGHFDTSLTDVAGFYRAMATEFARIVRPGGLVVLLLGDREVAAQLTDEQSLFQAVASFDLLVNGKKAALLKWRRLP